MHFGCKQTKCQLFLFGHVSRFCVIEYAACDAIYTESLKRLRLVSQGKAMMKSTFFQCIVHVTNDLTAVYAQSSIHFHS